MGYGRSDLNQIQKDLSKGKYYKVPEKGDNVFFCPPWNEKETKPYKEVMVHYNVSNEPVLCLGANFCPICKANNELRAMTANLVAQNLSKDIYAKPCYLYSVIPSVAVKSVGPNQGLIYYAGTDEIKPRPYLVSKKLHKVITSFFAFYGDIFDPMNGNLVGLTKAANGNTDPKFASVSGVVHPLKSRLEDRLMALMNDLPDLNTVIVAEPADKLQAMIDVKLASFRATNGAGTPPATVSVPAGSYQAPQMVPPNVPANAPIGAVPTWQYTPPAAPTVGVPPVTTQTTISNEIPPAPMVISQGAVVNPTVAQPTVPPSQPVQQPTAAPTLGTTPQDLDQLQKWINQQKGITN